MSRTSPAIRDCDLLVIGSGAGGLSAAVTAAHLGLKVIVAEKESAFGGTTAWSGGWMWIPRNPLAVEGGIVEPLEKPLSYLRHELGNRFDEKRARTFLEHGPRMVDFFRRKTALQFIDGNGVPDSTATAPMPPPAGARSARLRSTVAVSGMIFTA
jgi:succinate dehydrogenase/fumarate reductase flavoprotein subunit